MAEKHGKTGGVYAASAIRRATTISFTGTDTISDSANGFVTAGFVQAMKIVVIGADSYNNNTYTIATGGVAAGAITTTGTPNTVNEAAGNLVTIYQAPAGSAVAGFYNWKLDWKSDVAEVTDFGSSGAREYLAGVKEWTATAERFWQTDDNIWNGSGIGSLQWVRFFTRYVAIPTAPDPAHYFEGLAEIKTINYRTPNDDAIKQTFEFQGIGALASTVKTSAW
jgi:predicted secreted protein